MGVIECIFNLSECWALIRQETMFWSLVVMGVAAAIFPVRHHASLPFINTQREPLDIDSDDLIYVVPAFIAFVLLHIVA